MSTEKAASLDECIETMQDTTKAKPDLDEEEMSFTSSSDSDISTNCVMFRKIEKIKKPLFPKEMIVSYTSHSTGKVISEHIVENGSNHDSDEEDESDSDIEDQFTEASTGDSSFDQTLSSQGEYDEAQPAQLCVHCQNIADNLWRVVEAKEEDIDWQHPHLYFPYWGSFYALESSAESGCSLCFQLNLHWKSQGSDAVETSKREYDEWASELEVDCVPRGVVGVYLSYNSTHAWQFSFEGFESLNSEDSLASKDGLPWKKERRQKCNFGLDRRSYAVVSAIPVQARTSHVGFQTQEHEFRSTRDSLPYLKEWMGICCDKHGECHILDNSFRPSRLIYLGDERPRLHLSQDLEETPKYATLSHCWGKVRFKTLTKQTEKIFTMQIPPEALSATFNDAIMVVKELGLQYLWIDSLCIIQDDENDWAKESALMMNVYGNSTLNIAASRAANGNQGLFAPRSKQWACCISEMRKSGPVHYRCIPWEYYSTAMNSPLESRGWTLQERLLATRTLHFTAFEVFWECCQKVACESFPTRYPQPIGEDKFFGKRSISLAQWSPIIQAYCRRQLTMSKDKLVAISGIARQVQSKCQDQYIAGLWARRIERQLCWRGQGHANRKALHKRIPTWSWASVNGYAEFGKRNLLIFKVLKAKVYKVEIVMLHDDPFGELWSARLHVYCEGLFYATFYDKESNDLLINLQRMVTGQKYMKCFVEFAHAECYGKRLRILFLGISEDSVRGDPEKYDYWASFLLLKPTGKQGQYERIGYADVDIWDPDDDFDDACKAKESDYCPRDMNAMGLRQITLV